MKHVHNGDGEVQLRGGIGCHAYPSKGVFFFIFSMYIDNNTISSLPCTSRWTGHIHHLSLARKVRQRVPVANTHPSISISSNGGLFPTTSPYLARNATPTVRPSGPTQKDTNVHTAACRAQKDTSVWCPFVLGTFSISFIVH